MKTARRGGPPRGFWYALMALVVVGVGALAWSATRPKVAPRRLDPSLPALKAEGYVVGSPTAPVEVVEFADFECPGCGQFATITEPDVRTTMIQTGKIRFRFMDFPLSIHKNTWDASLAAACASDQGKFWEMHDAIFANQDRWNGEATSRPRGVLSDLAKGLGLDMGKYDACMDAETHRARIEASAAEGTRRGVPSTPTYIFNGTMVSQGALPFDAFKRFVDEATAAAAKAPAGAATQNPAGATTASPAGASTQPARRTP